MSSAFRRPALASGLSLLLCLLLVAPVSAATTPPRGGPTASPTSSTPPAPRSAPTATPAPTSTRPMLRQGSRGASVLTVQRRLTTLGYWVGTPSGRYDHATTQAVMALQKVAGLERDGVTGPATWRALDRGVVPRPRSTRGRVLEIDLTRQVIIFAVDGNRRYVVNTSTGTPRTPTPRGSYRAFRQIDRWHTAPLGMLYRPKFFHRGYAVHGVADGNIPGYPASHGCARVSTAAMDMLWTRAGLRIGDRVLVY